MRRFSSLPCSRHQFICSCNRQSFMSPTRPRPPAHHHYSTAARQPIDIQEMMDRPAKIIRDRLTPMPSYLLSSMLSDLSSQEPPSTAMLSSSSGQGLLPQGHHLVYFPLLTQVSKLAPDGADVDHAPSEQFVKRLWAGGEVHFHRPSGGGSAPNDGLVLDGRPWTCRETIEKVKVRGSHGVTGEEKAFVDVWRRYGLGHEEADVGREWSVEERRTLVFMRKPENEVAPSSNIVKYPHLPAHSTSVLPTPHHLFQFSALTYNAHSIHLDPLYAKSQDGHRALLVHGPLTLALMLRVLNEHLLSTRADAAAKVEKPGRGGLVKSFVYRNYAPLYVGERMTVCVRQAMGGRAEEGEESWDVWIEGPEGVLSVKGTALVDL